MKKNSTLIYLIKNFKKQKTPDLHRMNTGFESSYAKAEKGIMTPSEQTINNILGFAQSYEVMDTKNNGQVEMILN